MMRNLNFGSSSLIGVEKPVFLLFKILLGSGFKVDIASIFFIDLFVGNERNLQK